MPYGKLDSEPELAAVVTRAADVSELWDWCLGPVDIHRSEAHRAGTRELLLILEGVLDLVVGETRHRFALAMHETAHIMETP